MTEREDAVMRLHWSNQRLKWLHELGDLAPPAEVAAAWEEHCACCRRLTRIYDGVRR